MPAKSDAKPEGARLIHRLVSDFEVLTPLNYECVSTNLTELDTGRILFYLLCQKEIIYKFDS